MIDSRLANDGDQVRRRRECLSCAARFTTYESAELVMPRVVKGDGAREAFDEQKLRTGMLRALEKRPVAMEAIEAAINRIQHAIRALAEREVASRDIGELVMNELRDLDQIAYVRFASIYRSFEDVEAFREVVDHLQNEPSPEQKKQQLSLLPGDSDKS